MTKPTKKPQGFPIVAGIFALFVAPLLIAWILYQYHYLGPTTTNVGTLIKPPQQLSQLKFIGPQPKSDHSHWRLIYVNTTNHCGTTCKKTLYKLRQTHTATGKNRNRLQRWALLNQTTPLKLAPAQPELIVAQIDNTSQKRLTATSNHPAAELFFLADPIGNILMVYPSDVTFKGLLKDIKHLLKASQIG